MVTTKMSEATAIIEDGGEIRKVAVQINILRIGPTAGPSIELMALNVKSHKNGLSKSYNIYISSYYYSVYLPFGLFIYM